VQTRILPALPEGHKTDLYCGFFEAGAKYGSLRAPSVARPSEALHLHPFRDSILLALHVDSFKHLTPDDARRVAGATTLLQTRKTGGKSITWLLDGDVPLRVFRQLVMGLLLAAYRFTQFKSQRDEGNRDCSVTIIAGANAAAFRRELKRLEAVNAGVTTARDLANLPANHLHPADLAQRGKAVAQKHGLSFSMLSGKQLASYAGITAVGQGSVNPPALFSLAYTPAKLKRGAQPLCLVGKGITFDSGGISIKPWEGMWDMRADMSGAAAVIGTLQSIAALELPVPVTGVIAAAENMPDGRAYRPGDVLKYKNGRTVEIHSTDAEGRLILADALLYAQDSLGLRRIVELSTLTGACVRALGNQYIGLLSRSPELAAQVKRAAESSGEPVWELPLHPEYRKLLDSSLADLKNVGGPLAGASTAGMFLHEFVHEGTEYVHLDIAGVFNAEKADKYWGQAGATGAGVRLSTVLAELEAGARDPSL
jgi:leucyl aminopeptidase